MIEETGDLLSVTRGIIVHGCNAQGVMGSGVAKAVRERYPVAYEAYMQAHRTKGLRVGQVVWATLSKEEPRLALANAITQKFYGRDPNRVYVDYDGIFEAMTTIGNIARRHDLPVHYPKIGAGLGNGDWTRISAILDLALKDVSHTLWIPEWERAPTEPKPATSRRTVRPG